MPTAPPFNKPALRICFTRLDPTHHRFEVIDADGNVDRRHLETRGGVIHDLLHFALESEAGLRDSFYGRMASGTAYDELSDSFTGEAVQTEAVVGALQGAVRGEVDPAQFVARFCEICRQIERPAPAWLTAEVIASALARYRSLIGRWKATPFGQTLELDWPAADKAD